MFRDYGLGFKVKGLYDRNLTEQYLLIMAIRL